jgi:heat shock protein HtpX
MRVFERGTGCRRLTVASLLYVTAVFVAVGGTIALWYAVGRVASTVAWTMLGGLFVLLWGALPAWYGGAVPPAVEGLVVGGAVAGGVIGTTWLLVRSVHAGHRRLLADTRPPEAAERRHQATLDRLARQADVPAPELRFRADGRSLCYTLYDELGVVVDPQYDGDTYVVVTPALLDRLSDDEVEAVLAHEVAHVANGDLWLLSLLLVPVLWAERLLAQARVGGTCARRVDSLVEAVVGAALAVAAGVVGRVLRTVGAAALAVLARGREYDADRGAAAITDDPAALAAAIERLDGASLPREDERDVDAGAATTAAMTVVPTAERGPLAHVGGTHPPAEERIRRLTELTRA